MAEENEIRQVRAFRLSDDEYDRLRLNAETYGCTMSELIRRTAIYGQDAPPVIIDTSPVQKVLFELKMEGNNLNQLVHEIHMYGMSPALEKTVNKAIKKNMEITERVGDLVIDIRKGKLNL